VRRLQHQTLLLLTVSAFLLSLSQSQAQEQQEEALKLSTQLVVADVQVLNKKTGVPVRGLTERDFLVYEDGVKQQLTHFSKDSLPLSIVLLLDVSGSVMPVIDSVRDSGLKALNELKPGDEVALMAFGVWTSVLQEFTKDRQLVAERLGAIERMGPWIREGTYIDEAVYESAKHFAKASIPDSRRIIIIITDNFSSQPPSLGHSEADSMQQLHAAGASVCGLVVGDFNAAVNEYRKKNFFIKDSIGGYITETGGILSQVDKDDVTVKLARLIERLRSRYSLGYTPLNEKRDGRFRNIKVKLLAAAERREGEVTIIARKGYYAPR
jgi:VWFA-related protein